MIKVLFICGQNRLRSPTAEQLFCSWPGVEADSAGVGNDADVQLTAEQVLWADLLVVMEVAHKRKLAQRFRPQLRGKKVVCVDIPDHYAYMQPELVTLLQQRVGPHLRR